MDFRSKSLDYSKEIRNTVLKKQDLKSVISKRKVIVEKERERNLRFQAIQDNTVEHLNHEKDVYRKNQMILEYNKKLVDALERDIYTLESQLHKVQNKRISVEKEQEKLDNFIASYSSENEVLEGELGAKNVQIERTKDIIANLHENLQSVMEAALL